MRKVGKEEVMGRRKRTFRLMSQHKKEIDG